MLDTRREITGRVSLVGHRGAAACAPENTLVSFREGLIQGADIIELDVQLSADGHVVAFHDDQLDRTTDDFGPLVKRTLAELKALDAGSWFDPRFAGESIPTLDEVLVWANGKVPLFIELKYGAYSDPAHDVALDATVVKLVAHHGMLDQVMVISFDHHALQRVKRHAANLATGALYIARVDDPVDLARDIGANAVMPLCHTVTAEDVALCHDAGLAVNVWGADADYAALIAAGVDCLNADFPALVRRNFLPFEQTKCHRCCHSEERSDEESPASWQKSAFPSIIGDSSLRSE
jgi:glycerophosphoryl diester phosphodiesterase